jgi:hypothetical protein
VCPSGAHQRTGKVRRLVVLIQLLFSAPYLMI